MKANESNAKVIRKQLLATLTALVMSADAWTVTRSVDEITDETAFYVFTHGSPIEVAPLVTYAPELVFRVIPKGSTEKGGLKFKGDLMLSIESDGLTRSGTEIITRFDRSPATAETWEVSANRRAAFSPDWKRDFDRLKTATNLTVRFTTTLGHTRTTTFDVSNFTNALSELKARHLK